MSIVFRIPPTGPTSERVVKAIHELDDALAERYGENFVFMVYGNNRRLAVHTGKSTVEPTIEAAPSRGELERRAREITARAELNGVPY